MTMNLEQELELATTLARKAGELTLKYHCTDLVVNQKDHEEPVTKADRESEVIILDGIREAFPDDGILAEETPDKTSWARYRRVWVVDPLDGTKDFIAGLEGFSIMIGMLVDRVPVLGVIYQPTSGLVFRAAEGTEAQVLEPDGTSRILRVSQTKKPEKMRLVVSNSHRSERVDRVKQTLGISDEIKIGSVGLKISLVARDLCDLYVHPTGHCKLWDICAPEAVLTAAGGKMTDLFGAPLAYSEDELKVSRGIVASNGPGHDEVVDRIGPLFPGQDV